MKSEFVTAKQALELKEVGFDGKCFGYYNMDPQLKSPPFNMFPPFDHEWCLPAPLKSQVFKYFRDKYGIYNTIDRIIADTRQVIFVVGGFGGDYSSYEEAEDAYINILIKILKKSKYEKDNQH